MGFLRRIQGSVREGRSRHVRLGLGMAREEGGRLARHRFDEQRRDAADDRRQAAPDDRRVGARLLHRLPQRPSEIRRGVLEHRELGFCREELRVSDTLFRHNKVWKRQQSLENCWDDPQLTLETVTCQKALACEGFFLVHRRTRGAFEFVCAAFVGTTMNRHKLFFCMVRINI
ncbi:protein of unknown function [Burkholderia multivorans]